MLIRNFRHKGLKQLYEGGRAKLPADCINKLRNMLSFIDAMESEDELRNLQKWKAHQLTGDRSGVWSLHVTANWRLTLWVDPAGPEACDLDFEDYH